MDSNAATVEGMLNCLPDMKSVFLENFKPVQDKLASILQHSQSHFTALAGRESFAGFLNVPLISDALVKTIEVMFEAPMPCVLQLQNDEASANITWLDVVKEKNYQAEYQGNGNYHFHMRDWGVIIQLSAFQHNMILSGLPRKLVQPWSYEQDVQTELSTLALAAEMTSLPSVIKVNNAVLEEILRRDRVLRHNPSQRSAGSPFPMESAEEPAQYTPAQVEADFFDEMAIETQATDVQASGSKYGTRTRNYPKNRAWPAEVLKQLPLWFEDQVRKDLSQEEIAQNFDRKFNQKRTFHAIEAKVYFLTGKSPFRKRNKRNLRKEPVSLTPRSSPHFQPLELVESTQQFITRSNIEVHALSLSSSLLPHLNSEDCDDGSLYAAHGVQPVDPESESSDPHAVSEHDIANQALESQRASQAIECSLDISQSEWPAHRSFRAEESPTAPPMFSDLVHESRLTTEKLTNDLATTSMTVADSLLQGSSSESSQISEPIQFPIRHHSEGDITFEELGQTLIHPTGSSAMHVEQADTAHDNQPPGRNCPQSSLGTSLTGGSSNECSNNESHRESGIGALTVPKAPTVFQIPEASSTDESTEHHSRNRGMGRPTPDTSERTLAEEELIRRYLREKSQAQAGISHRSWIAKDLERLPGWLMKRNSLPRDRLEVEFLRDFGHFRTSFAIRAACRKKKKADSRQKDGLPDTMPVSRPTNTIVDTPSLEPSHTIAGNDSTTPKHPPSVQCRPSQFGHPQVPDNRERPYRSSPAFYHEGEEAKELNSPAASEDSSEQMVLSTSSGKFENTPQSGNRGHRATTLKYRASFTAINGDNHHPTDPDISELTPVDQMESNEREQGSRRASKGIPVERRRDDQHMSQEGSLSKFSNAVLAIVRESFKHIKSICHLTFLQFFLYLSLRSTLTVFVRPCRQKRKPRPAFL
ncbi:uncharacterized protein N7511_000871 [Penicillium nucicola]|uniref:uncharacterized protein n=1 Tax=Penicillium nucicola TaxID=1850975 RepID=UPI0025451776|nr:uncharacterized protein N7511_000871 [Penicillium nucicola]KAJ5775860.1 hypothetical protein N7511_000871 [Penicillium nucicola]